MHLKGPNLLKTLDRDSKLDNQGLSVLPQDHRGIPGSICHRRIVRGLSDPDPLVPRFRLSKLRQPKGLAHQPAGFQMPELQKKSLCNRRNRNAQEPSAPAILVLGRLFDEYPDPWDIRLAASKAIGVGVLPDRLVSLPTFAQSYG